MNSTDIETWEKRYEQIWPQTEKVKTEKICLLEEYALNLYFFMKRTTDKWFN